VKQAKRPLGGVFARRPAPPKPSGAKSTAVVAGVLGLGLAVVLAVLWSGDDVTVTATSSAAAASGAPSVVPAARASLPKKATSLWAWGDVGSGSLEQVALAPEDALWARAMLPPDQLKAGEDPQDSLRKLAQDNPDVMKRLLSRYAKESDIFAKELILSLLSTIEKPEVLDFSKRLATSADAAQRKDGLALLGSLSTDSQEVHAIIRQSLANEHNPGLIVQALAALKPPAVGEQSAAKTPSAAEVAESAAVVAQLQGLTKNADPLVRSQSLLQLAQWDKAGNSLDHWSQALTDQAAQVRQAAVFAIAQSGTQSDGAKTALLNVVNNVNESRDVRGSALQALERFALSRDEAANFSQFRSQVMGL